MTKNKIFICFSVFFVCILFSFAFSVNVEALDDKVDVSIDEPFVVTQGEPITANSVKQSLYYGNISLSSMLKSITLIDGSSHVSIGNLNSIAFNDSETYKELTLRIVYTIPGTKCDMFAPSVELNVAEGTFDVLGIFCNVKNFERNNEN